jgi:hypothetical protein
MATTRHRAGSLGAGISVGGTWSRPAHGLLRGGGSRRSGPGRIAHLKRAGADSVVVVRSLGATSVCCGGPRCWQAVTVGRVGCSAGDQSEQRQSRRVGSRRRVRWGPGALLPAPQPRRAVSRRYDQHLPETEGEPVAHGCWFRNSASQPMRNAALAEVLRRRDGVQVRYALCAPLANETIWRRWGDARRVLPEELLIDLLAEHVLAHHTSAVVAGMRERYSSASRAARTSPPAANGSPSG